MASHPGFGSILVPLDGHPLAEQALPVARHLAQQAGATLHLVTVQPPMSPLILTSEVAAAAQELFEVARLFRETADLLDLGGANAFCVRAYRNAARTVEELPQPLGRWTWTTWRSGPHWTRARRW
jgi:nucleotide-binding universal stress UspA family protein